jgi:hypothetical protein
MALPAHAKALGRREIAAAVAELRQLRLHLHLCVLAGALERAGTKVTLVALARYLDPVRALALPMPGPSKGEPDTRRYFREAPPPPQLNAVRRALRQLAKDPDIARRFEQAVDEGRDACGPLASVLIEAAVKPTTTHGDGDQRG